MASVVRIDGWAEFSRALGRIDRDAAKGLRVAANKVADVVARDARARVPLGPAPGGHARSTVKAASTRTAARVAGGGKRFSYYGWLDFGGSTGRTDRPYIQRGRYIWSAFADNREHVDTHLHRELAAVARAAGVHVR